jgi:arylsulfatase
MILCDDLGWSDVSASGYILKLHADTFKDFPPRQAPANFNAQEMLNSVLQSAAGEVGGR